MVFFSKILKKGLDKRGRGSQEETCQGAVAMQKAFQRGGIFAERGKTCVTTFGGMRSEESVSRSRVVFFFEKARREKKCNFSEKRLDKKQAWHRTEPATGQSSECDARFGEWWVADQDL